LQRWPPRLSLWLSTMTFKLVLNLIVSTKYFSLLCTILIRSLSQVYYNIK
jgi:hypothetical protein